MTISSSALPNARPELRVYEAALEDLMARYRGQYVVIHGDKVEQLFTNYGEALEWAYERHGGEPFFVKQISEEENVAHFIRDLGPCRIK